MGWGHPNFHGAAWMRPKPQAAATGFGGYTPTADYKLPIPREAPLSPDMQQQALTAARNVQNPATQMMAALPWIQRTNSAPTLDTLTREGGIQARNLGNYQASGLNQEMSTLSPQAQMARQMMAANVGVAHGGLIRQSDQMKRMRDSMLRRRDAYNRRAKLQTTSMFMG